MSFRMKSAFVCLGIGGAIAFAGYQDFRLAGFVEDEPSFVSCEELEGYGPGENHHVVLYDYVLSPGYVYESDGSRWTRVWVPAVPIGSAAHNALERAYGDGDMSRDLPVMDFNVIVELTDVRSDADIEPYAMAGQLQGIVVNEIRGMDSTTKALLRESYPGVNIDHVWLLAAEEQPPTASAGMVQMGIGAAGMLAGMGIFFTGSRRPDPDGVSLDPIPISGAAYSEAAPPSGSTSSEPMQAFPMPSGPPAASPLQSSSPMSINPMSDHTPTDEGAPTTHEPSDPDIETFFKRSA